MPANYFRQADLSGLGAAKHDVFMPLRSGFTEDASHSKSVKIRGYTPADHANWLAMRFALWPESDEADALAWILRQDAKTLVAEAGNNGSIVGFAEIGKRAYADGCDTSPVAFLEGWYVTPARRRQGIGMMLIRACMIWAKQENLHALASDSLLTDVSAYKAHISVGFTEVERSVKYRMVLE